MSTTIDPAMAREFGFDEADVTANRQGRLTSDQQIMFANAARKGRSRVKLLVGVVCVMVVVAVVVALIASNSELTLGLIASIVGIALLPVVGITVVSRAMGNSLSAFENPRVASVDGRATWQNAASEGVYLFIGDITFVVFGDQAELFDPARTYRVHYLVARASTQSILSVEVVA